MALYVQIIDGQVAQCIDTVPPSPIGTDGWKNAVEVKPTIDFNKQRYDGHTWDLTKDPVEIVYATATFTLDERKNQMIIRANAPVMELTMEQNFAKQANQAFDATKLTAAQATANTLITQINAATTDAQLDAITI